MRLLWRKLFGLVACFLLALACVLALARHSTPRQPIAEVNGTDSTSRKQISNKSHPQQIATLEGIATIDRSVLAGGGGTSSGGGPTQTGTVGEVSASNMQSGSGFQLNGGFWNTLSTLEVTPTPTPSPTPTPTPTPTATPTPTPTPTGSIQLLLDSSGPDPAQAAALDSVSLLRDPFKVINESNFFVSPNDRNTRVIVFAANLSLSQGEAPSAVVVSLIDANQQTFNVTAEDVRPVLGFSFAQVVFRLPDNLAPGPCTVGLTLHGQISNSGTFRIRT